MAVRRGGGEIFLNLKIKSQSFSGSEFLDCDLLKYFLPFFFPPSLGHPCWLECAGLRMFSPSGDT